MAEGFTGPKRRRKRNVLVKTGREKGGEVIPALVKRRQPRSASVAADGGRLAGLALDELADDGHALALAVLLIDLVGGAD
jgi:hypothetical protein